MTKWYSSCTLVQGRETFDIQGVCAMKPLVSDELWDHIQPLLPSPPQRRFRFPGRKPLDYRKILTGILFVQDRHGLGRPARRTGLRLRQDLPSLPPALAPSRCLAAIACRTVGRTQRGRSDRLGAGLD